MLRAASSKVRGGGRYRPAARRFTGRSTQHAALFVVLLASLGCGAPQTSATESEPVTGQDVIPGIEVLLADSLHLIRGRRVGIITNHSGRDRRGTSTIDLLHRAPGVRLTAIFGPEHGARVYTYVWTMALAAEAAKKSGKRFIVLDRPNPIRADRIEGGVLDPRYKSFTGLHPVALRYGLTPGEMIRYLIGAKLIDADATVVPMKNYRLSMWWDETGLEWRNPARSGRTRSSQGARSR